MFAQKSITARRRPDLEHFRLSVVCELVKDGGKAAVAVVYRSLNADLNDNETLRRMIDHHHHPSLNREGRWGATDNFATSFLHFSLFPTALWDLANSGPVHSLMLSSNLFLCLPCLLPPFTVPCKMVLARSS